MTRARVVAHQAARPAKSARLVRGTVATVSPLTVQIAGSNAVRGLALPGQLYTAGDPVLVAVQEPAVGAVYPLTATPPPDLTPYAKTADLPTPTSAAVVSSGTRTDWGAGLNLVTRLGPIVTLRYQINVGATPPTNGTTLGTIPAGFRPSGSVFFGGQVHYGPGGGWGNNTWQGQINTDGTIVLNTSTTAVAAGQGLFLTATYS